MRGIAIPKRPTISEMYRNWSISMRLIDLSRVLRIPNILPRSVISYRLDRADVMRSISARVSPQNCDVIAIEEMSSPRVLAMKDVTTRVGVRAREAE